MADPGQEIVSHGMGHALGEIIVVVLLALLVKLLGLDKQWPRALAWVHGRLWARVGVTCLVLLAVVFLLAVAFDVLPTGMSCCGAAAEWVLQTTTLSFPRWVVWLAVSLAALKIWDWRYALMRTVGKAFSQIWASLSAIFLFVIRSGDRAILIGTWDVCINDYRAKWTFLGDGTVLSTEGVKEGRWHLEKTTVFIQWSHEYWETLTRPLRATRTVGNSWQGAGTLVATKLPSEYGVRTIPHPESRTPSVPSVSSRRPAASAASNTPDEFLAKVAGIWRHRWGRNGVEYVRIDANGNYYVALDDKEVRVFTLEGIQIGSTTRTVNWQKIDTGEFRPEQFPKGHRRLSEELQIDASTGDMAGRGGPDHHNVSYEKVATVPTARAMEFFKAAAGNWHLDYSTGQENIRLDVFGNYFLIDAGNRETHYFTMENVDFDPASNRVAFDKVDSGQYDARTRPKGRRHTRDEVEIAPDASTMAGSDNEGRHLTYTRIHR